MSREDLVTRLTHALKKREVNQREVAELIHKLRQRRKWDYLGPVLTMLLAVVIGALGIGGEMI